MLFGEIALINDANALICSRNFAVTVSAGIEAEAGPLLMDALKAALCVENGIKFRRAAIRIRLAAWNADAGKKIGLGEQ